jgi:hypothetical protein
MEQPELEGENPVVWFYRGGDFLGQGKQRAPGVDPAVVIGIALHVEIDRFVTRDFLPERVFPADEQEAGDGQSMTVRHDGAETKQQLLVIQLQQRRPGLVGGKDPAQTFDFKSVHGFEPEFQWSG